MRKIKPIRERIRDAIIANGDGGFLVYHKLAEAVFPRDHFPKAWNCPTRGGPPGCYMVLSRAIREHGFFISHDGPAVVYSTVGLGENKTI